MLKQVYSPAKSVQQSRWITRGWTYQEGFLSRRKLFFTEQGVALWCGLTYYEEGVSRNLPDRGDRGDHAERQFIPRVIAKVAPVSYSVDMVTVHMVIGEYTKREITFEHDTLNACLGVLNYLGCKHLWGIVIQEQPFSLDLCWSIAHDGAPEQEAFPSWSWTRWKGPVTFYLQDRPSSIASIKTRLPSGEELDILRDSRYKGNLGAICSGKVLRITGTFLTSRFLVEEEDHGVSCYSIILCACGADIKMSTDLDMGTGSFVFTTANLDGTEILEVTQLYKDTEGCVDGQFLLVQRHMDAYRRIGLAFCGRDYRIKHICEKLEHHKASFIVPLEGRYVRTIDLI